MHIRQLRINHLRNLDAVVLPQLARINYITGSNGAGKTSILEAMYLLSHPRSFRAGSWRSLIQRQQPAATVFAELETQESTLRLGLKRATDSWEARINGNPVDRLSTFVSHAAIMCFEPGMHTLVSGGAHARREFVDWGVFHLNHAFLTQWQRYKRALKQRNYLLRKEMLERSQLAVWDEQMVQSAQQLDQLRENYLAKLRPHIQHIAHTFLPELGAVEFRYYRGWHRQYELQDVLQQNLSTDVRRGHTTSGPHRADWALHFEHAPAATDLSRGQQKLGALVCVLAQAFCFRHERREWPILCLDDLQSELDETHYQRVCDLLFSEDAQIFITSVRTVEPPSSDVQVFHVEHGVPSLRE